MLNFKQHVINQHINQFTKHDLNIDRKDMPQITQINMGNFIEHMKKHGVSYVEKRIDPLKLKASQNEIHIDKVESLLSKFDNAHKKPLVSSDNYVLDGHHTVLAQRVREKPVDVIQFSCDIHRFIELAHQFDKVEYRESVSI